MKYKNEKEGRIKNMEKLQYDSFYKFIVSVGAVLIAAPVIGLYYLLSSSYGINISKQEYLDLSLISMKFIQNKENLLDIVFSALPIVFFGLIVIGLVCIIWGGSKWYKIQKTLDDSIKLDVDEKRYNYEKLTTSEIVEKVLNDETENQETQQITDINILNAAAPKKELSSHEYLIKALHIENLCYKSISKKLGRNYIVSQNIRFGSREFDIVATSKRDNRDYLYEVKYWNNQRGVYRPAIEKTFSKIKESGIYYEMETRRNFKWTLLIVANTENLERLQKQFDQYLLQEGSEYTFIEIEYIDEKDLAD